MFVRQLEVGVGGWTSNLADDSADGCFDFNFNNVSSLNGATLSSELSILIAPFVSKSFTLASSLFAND